MARTVNSYDLSRSALNTQRILQLSDGSLSRKEVQELLDERPEVSVEDIDSALEELSDKNWVEKIGGKYRLTYEMNFDGGSLGELGIEVDKVSETVLADTLKETDNLRIEGLMFEEKEDFLVLKAKLRYNGAEEKGRRYGYSYTGFLPVMKFSEETNWQLIKEFSFIAFENPKGFANFHPNATRTKTPLDRLKSLTLPEVIQS